MSADEEKGNGSIYESFAEEFRERASNGHWTVQLDDGRQENAWENLGIHVDVSFFTERDDTC